MKTNELRIGNLVLIPSHANKNIPLVPCIEKKILGITKFGELDFTEPTYPEPHLVHYNHCSGIPLTEEWLLRFGFYKNELYVKHGNGADWQPKYPKTTYQCFNLEVSEDKYFVFVIEKYEWLSNKEIKSDTNNAIIFNNFYPTQVDSSDFINCLIPKYVHQLQNLYFALTGNELKIK